ncbi:MAG: sigma-70 family RNA polymerase sigma factor [Planctomycetes bacterium]|nr:sigma-70 family RNA polymerase sigma factor [Planctomycetota bacterium]
MSDHPLDVAACLARVARNDQDAARALVAHCHPLVAKLVRSHLPRQQSEEDLIQEVYMKMFARLDQYHPVDGIPFEHWLSRLTVNTCLDALRTEGRRPRTRQAALSDGAETWLESLGSDQAQQRTDDVVAARELVEALLSRLEPKDRLVLTMLDLEERPVAEIAQVTGWSRTLVKVRAFRARRRLRAIAERMQAEESHRG